MPTFTLASFNICSAHFREGHYTEDNLARLAACICESRADVVALQEVDRGAERSERVDMTARLSEMTGLSHHYFIKIRDFQGGEYGTAILSRYPIRESRTINYPVRVATQGTSCGSVVLDVDGTPVTVYNTHLSCETEEANTETLECLRDVLDAHATTDGGAFLVCGDFNTSPAKIARYLPHICRAHEGLITFADKSIDHILYVSPITVANVRTADTQADGTTDHYMVLCEVTVPPMWEHLTEEERLAQGLLFSPADPTLKAIKLRTHNLNLDYNATYEDETEKRAAILAEMFAEIGEGSFIQGPLYCHYGKHTRIGRSFFGNFHLTIQDDAEVTIGDRCNFGPNVTIVTPVHPMRADERHLMYHADGALRHLCYAKPVHIGHDCWLGASVTVCPGVTVGDGCVIGAGSVVTRDIPAHTFAAGVPCRVIRPITEADSMEHHPERLGGCRINKFETEEISHGHER